jgi:hypothetical protein
MGEYEVPRFNGHVARKTGFEQRLVGRFAVFKLSEPPTARGRVFFFILDHKLNICGSTGNEGLATAKDFVVFLGRDVTPGQPGNNCAVRERQLSFPIGLDR